MSEVNKLAEKICKVAEREFEKQIEQAVSRFISEVKVVNHLLRLKNENGESFDFALAVRQLATLAMKAQMQEVHDKAIRDFYNRYSEIERFMLED